MDSCWVCKSPQMVPFKEGAAQIKAQDLKITDSLYGLTLPLYRCQHCGFVQAETKNVLELYRELEDEGYQESSGQRRKQFRKLIAQTAPYLRYSGKSPDVLDIGTGMGLFVDEAQKLGWNALGLEPSQWLSRIGQEAGLPVLTGIFPDDRCPGPYDAIYLTDVIEHLENPHPTLAELPRCLADEGRVFVTTPNVSSLAARLMGPRHWWHYRIAHVGYYNKKTLSLLMERAGLEAEAFMFAKWYFDGDYIFERLGHYISPLRGRSCPAFLRRMTFGLNFFDSYLAVLRKRCSS